MDLLGFVARGVKSRPNSYRWGRPKGFVPWSGRFVAAGRDASSIANVALPQLLGLMALHRPTRSIADPDWTVAGGLADRRLWHPAGADFAPLPVTERGAADIVAPQIDPRRWEYIHKKFDREVRGIPSNVLGFRKPSKVEICVKRWARREVMHALGYAGRRVAGFKRRRTSELSKVVC